MMKKFEDCEFAINLLMLAGFEKSKDGSKLIFRSHKLEQLKEMQQMLDAIST